jgi:hypothetical protein
MKSPIIGKRMYDFSLGIKPVSDYKNDEVYNHQNHSINRKQQPHNGVIDIFNNFHSKKVPYNSSKVNEIL